MGRSDQTRIMKQIARQYTR